VCTASEVIREPTRERTCVRLNASGRFDQNATRTSGSRRAGRHSEHRAVAGADQPLRRVRNRGCAKRSGAQIIDDHVLAFGRHHVWDVGGRRVHDRSPPLVEAGHAQRIVRQHLAHDHGEPWQRGVDIDRDGELAEQFQRVVEIGALRVRTVDGAFLESHHRDNPRNCWIASRPLAACATSVMPG
jgi:hypothetical protein